MIHSTNEWDTLREVFVGNIENPNNPIKGKDLHCINYANRDNIDDVREGYYPKQVIEETKEDLEELSQTAKPDVDAQSVEETESDTVDVSLDEISENENQEADVSAEDSESSNS